MTRHTLGFSPGQGRIRTTTLPSKPRAMFNARKILDELVYDTVALEDNPLTFPEVKTQVDGITVGGRRTRDVEQVLNQHRSWHELIALVETGTFRPDIACFENLHAHAARDEPLEWGKLRTGSIRHPGAAYQPPDAKRPEPHQRHRRPPRRPGHDHPAPRHPVHRNSADRIRTGRIEPEPGPPVADQPSRRLPRRLNHEPCIR